MIKRIALTSAFIFLIAVCRSSGAQQEITKNSLDTARCGMFRDGKPIELDIPGMLYALGLTDTPSDKPWSADKPTDKQGNRFQYRVAFTEPVQIGSVLCSAQSAGLLKPEAPFPGDPENPDHWLTVTVPAGTMPSQAVFEKSVFTRAVLLSESRDSGISAPGPVRFYKQRFFNIAPLAVARAKTEYHAPADFGGGHYRAIDLVRGRGSWISGGKNKQGVIVEPLISDVHPQWLIIAWDEPRRLSGLYLEDNFKNWALDVFDTNSPVNPLVAVDSEWRGIRSEQMQVVSQQGRWIAFTEPLITRGLRIRVTEVMPGREDSGQIAVIEKLLAFEDIGEKSCPAVGFNPPPVPFEFVYESPRQGFMTLVVNDEDDRRVRNIFARTQREAGAHKQPWDLRDENGVLIPPGVYSWKAVTAPPLELHYEFSVYPDVSVHHPENTAWLNGHNGPGGWLADHSPPRSACVSGDMIFFGAPTAESGVSFAACDLTGRKLWGIHSFAAWSGGRSMAADDETVYVEHPGSGHYGAGDLGADRVWAVDIETHKWRSLMTEQQSERRLRGISAMAAREGKLVLAVNAKDNRLRNAAGWADVDIEHCRPVYPPARKPRRPYEIVPDPRDDFLRLFRLKGAPPGYGHPGGDGLIWLESERGPGRRQHIVLAFNKPVPIGSCVFPVPQDEDYIVRLSVLKPDGEFPPRPERRDQWIPFQTHGESAWAVALAPPDTITRALCITFLKGEDDELEALFESPADETPDALNASLDAGLDVLGKGVSTEVALPGDKGNAWSGRLEGMRILRRRFRNRFAEAAISVNSGKVDEHGVWHAGRDKPLSREHPAVYMLEWETPKTLRGLAVKEIDGQLTEIDAFTGPPDAAITLEDSVHWEKIGEFTPHRRMDHTGFAGHNALARYIDGMVDFGRDVTTRAIRLRVVSQWASEIREGSCAKDGLGLDPARCRIFGVAPLEYIGGEYPVDPAVGQRLEIVDGKSGVIEREVAIADPAHLAYAPDGTLYAVSGDRIVVVDFEHGVHKSFPVKAKQPGALACDRLGNVYVYDAAPEQSVIHVYTPDRVLLRQIGEPGGYEEGPWQPDRFRNVTSMAVDREDKLWVVEHNLWPKRITCWTTEGEFLREYLGPTEYGGGGVLDPWNKNRLFYGPLEFELDWKTGKSRLKNLTWTGKTPAGEVPVKINDRVYMVTRSRFGKQACGIVYLYENNRLKPVAAMGAADAFVLFDSPEFSAALGTRPLASLQFMWSDLNGDGKPQFEETVFEKRRIGALSDFDRNLNINAGRVAFEVREFLDNGVPVYAVVDYPLPDSGKYGGDTIFRLEDNNFYRLGAGTAFPEAGIKTDGDVWWTYKNEGAGVHPKRGCGPYTPGQVVCQFGMVGHETAPEGELGEFFVINSNFGVWNIWTSDGLLAGRIFRDLRDERRVSWSMPDNTRGMRLDNVTAGEEHFNGWFTRSRQDGRYYVVAGHNHASIVEVRGFDRFKRSSGELQVTARDIETTREWQRQMVAFEAREAPKVLDVYPVTSSDQDKKWNILPIIELPQSRLAPTRSASFQIGHDNVNLYVHYVTRGLGPFKNAGSQWDRLFQSGAGVDLLLGLDPEADCDRRAPVAGDKRVLAAMLDGKPVAVLYDAVNPSAPGEERWEAVSPTGRTTFDSVRILENARVLYNGDENSYTIEMTLPFKDLGFEPERIARIRLDWGILETDEHGSSVLQRLYWSNSAASIQADVPSEARLEPGLWGWAILHSRDFSRPQMDTLFRADPEPEDIERMLEGF